MMTSIASSRRCLFFLPTSELYPTLVVRLFHNVNDAGNFRNSSSMESLDDVERRLFGDKGNSDDSGSFFRKLDKIEKSHGRSMTGSSDSGGGNLKFMDGSTDSFDTLSDGMDTKLKKAATYFSFTDEIMEDDYKFRPDVTFWPGTTYTTRDLDLTKPGIQRNSKREQFETTTEEALRKADFRNVRFLSNFLTEAGIIIKRSQTKISAKAQRKVAREIKTARAFGLMPFTTMGTKPFQFGKSMKDDDEEFEFDDTYNEGASAPTEDMDES
ncbi:30S ribosomal protein S18, chloroplastic [Apostasia shenzhenica]|uniref:Small ribosomal subunit protein bS18c n=1 Tax=Apostasia shenzhenica TaxID=1088818 RepID=A0A2I0AU45_9ASPA|nr:30S ribosomal protein S18, chloroplastic [Apostasia shenzhenica]